MHGAQQHLWMHAYSLQKCIWTRACAPMQRCRTFFAMEAIANLSWVLREHRAGCHLLPALLPARQNQLPDAVRSRNPSKSTPAHDAVAAAVLCKHHPIIHVGAGLIQFVYKSHLRLATKATRNKNPFSPFFARVFTDTHTYAHTNSHTRTHTPAHTPAHAHALWRTRTRTRIRLVKSASRKGLTLHSTCSRSVDEY